MESPQEQPKSEPQATPGAGPPAPWATVPPPTPAPSRRKSWVPIFIIGAIALVVILCVVALVILWQTGVLSFFRPELASPQIIPAKVAVFGAVHADMQNLAGYKHIAQVYGDVPQVKDGVDNLLDSMEEQTGISFQDDIKPWLGNEVSFAVTNLQGILGPSEAGSKGPGYIVAAATRDTTASGDFLDKLGSAFEDQGYEVDKADYSGVTYYVRKARSEWETPLLFGTVKGFVFLASDTGVLEDMIDTANGKSDALAKDEHYDEIMRALPRDAVSYFVMPDLQDYLKSAMAASSVQLPEELSAQIEAFKGMGVAFTLEDDGLRMDMVTTFDPKALPEETLKSMQTQGTADRILKRIPAGALGFFSGADLATMWKNGVAALMENPDFEKQINDLSDQLGITIDEELLSWMTGEYALAVIEGEGIEGVPIGVLGVFEVSDEDKAEGTMNDLRDALEKMADVRFESEDIDGVEMQVVREPSGEEAIIFGYGLADKHLLIGFTEDGLRQAVGKDIRPITDDETFRKVQEHLPRGNGYFYINLEAIWKVVYDTLPDYEKESFDETAGPYLEPIKAIGAASSSTDVGKGISRGTLFIYIP